MPSPITYRPRISPGVPAWPHGEAELKPVVKAKPIFGKRSHLVVVARTQDASFDARRSWFTRLQWRLDRFFMRFAKATRGVVATEFALLIAALGPVCIAGGEQLGPPIDAYATQLHADVVAAQDLCNKLGCEAAQ